VVIGVAVLAILTSDSAILAWARSNAWTAAAVALGVLNLPIMTARFRTVLRAVPLRWRSAAAAAGADPAETFFGVVAPRAAPGKVAVLLNAAGQMLGETVVVAIVLSVENGSRQANGVTAFAPVPLAVHLWQDLTLGHPDLSNASVAASETLLLLAAIVALRFAARVLLRRRRRLAASA
jgi:ABC-type phosphate transport system permease subunit